MLKVKIQTDFYCIQNKKDYFVLKTRTKTYIRYVREKDRMKRER